jgi:gamma-glutamyl:cysteine ligase YbdK (ATP-grasp superfamily)
MSAKTRSLFEAWGIEIDYMIVDEDTLDVRSIGDEVLRDAAGVDEWVEDVDGGEIGWSNKLVTHVLELKNIEPSPSLDGLVASFEGSIQHLNQLLCKRGARLMPSGMHPWMQPSRETRIWPHESGPIYRAYHDLFDCKRHGWANLQSVHLNLPFADEHEFGRLMAAIRLVLPIIPALAASSPIVEGRVTGLLDNRLDAYRTNATRVPSITGEVIPEPIFAYEEYHSKVLGEIRRELRAVGADPVLLEQEWTNARGAIARFDRMAIEIRLIDAQECPKADLAVCAAIGGAVRAMVEERWATYSAQREWPNRSLLKLLDRCLELGPRAGLEDRRYAELFGADSDRVSTAGALWEWLVECAFAGPVALEEPIATVLRRGTLAERVLTALGPEFSRDALQHVYRDLCGCLSAGWSFRP